MDNISEERLNLVNPVLAASIRKLALMLSAEKIEIRVVQGLRTWNQQLELWQKGRDTRGNVIDRSQVVTDAPPGYSWHNFGLGVDSCPFDNGTPDWDLSHPVWKRMVQVGESLGLTSGSTFRSFPDWPHFQPQEVSLSPTDEDRQDFKDGGMEVLWKKYGLAPKAS